MDIFVKLGLFFLGLTTTALMLFFTAQSLNSIAETRDYVSEQNHSDAYAIRYASLSSFDADTVGAITVQEALTLIYNNATNHTPIIVRGPNGNLNAWVTGSGGWNYSTYNKPLGAKYGLNNQQISSPTYIGPLNINTTTLPKYDDLYRYLSNNYVNSHDYYVNIDPLNNGSLTVLVLVATLKGG